MSKGQRLSELTRTGNVAACFGYHGARQDQASNSDRDIVARDRGKASSSSRGRSRPATRGVPFRSMLASAVGRAADPPLEVSREGQPTGGLLWKNPHLPASISGTISSSKNCLSGTGKRPQPSHAESPADAKRLAGRSRVFELLRVNLENRKNVPRPNIELGLFCRGHGRLTMATLGYAFLRSEATIPSPTASNRFAWKRVFHFTFCRR